ncbi:hypothetical protein A9267_10000 [Shewanella sp. UCD-FRSSP16_17]|uniref:hypothetical protein n=1 Tax=Shewanella sp. UCD-FRSSP16_17 TaxID=1853256 RepID=UPI0007EED274|nr:hypothetical protein [Shewanella sp. UCD-FRSSP16_17]OBT08049.1 hypothetical protein A9267_10000 [Shewanella sp. UCD-FRSSP16_17]
MAIDTPDAKASIEELAKRVALKKERLQQSVEQLENEQLLQLAIVLQTYEDVIIKLSSRSGIELQPILSHTFAENIKLAEEEKEHELLSSADKIYTEHLKERLADSCLHTALSESLPPKIISSSALADLKVAFNVIEAKTDDLGQSLGSVYKSKMQKKAVSASNRKNRTKKITDSTVLLRRAAVEYLTAQIAEVGREAIGRKYYADLARGLRKHCKHDHFFSEDRPYIKAIKFALEELGMQREK